MEQHVKQAIADSVRDFRLPVFLLPKESKLKRVSAMLQKTSGKHEDFEFEDIAEALDGFRQ